MQELLEQLLGYVRGAWRFRWYMHLIAWPLCLGGWIMVHQLPDQYEASARIYVDTQSVLRPLLRGLAIQGNVGQEVKLMTRTLLSRPNLEKIARMTDMDLKATTPEAMEALLNRLQHTIKLSGGRGRDKSARLPGRWGRRGSRGRRRGSRRSSRCGRRPRWRGCLRRARAAER